MTFGSSSMAFPMLGFVRRLQLDSRESWDPRHVLRCIPSDSSSAESGSGSEQFACAYCCANCASSPTMRLASYCAASIREHLVRFFNNAPSFALRTTTCHLPSALSALQMARFHNRRMRRKLR